MFCVVDENNLWNESHNHTPKKENTFFFFFLWANEERRTIEIRFFTRSRFETRVLVSPLHSSEFLFDWMPINECLGTT